MRRLLKSTFYPLLVVFLAINTHSFYRSIAGVVTHYKVCLWFVLGVAIYYIARRFVKTNLSFFEIFTHELIHSIVAIVFLRRIRKFVVGENEGVVYHSGKNSNNVFIALAPYCFPLYSIVLLIIKIAIVGKFIWMFDILIGFTVGFHGSAFWKEISPHQSDITRSGILFSYLFIWAFLLFFASIILWSIQGSIGGALIQWWKNLVSLANYVS